LKKPTGCDPWASEPVNAFPYGSPSPEP